MCQIHLFMSKLVIVGSGGHARVVMDAIFASTFVLVGLIDDYAKIGGVKAETRVPVARVGIGMAVRQGDPVPNISIVDTFKRTLLAAGSIGVTDPAMPNASGILAQNILTRSGMIEASATRRPSMPCTRRLGSTTAFRSVPIWHVPQG